MKTQPKLIIENVRNSFRWLERDDRNEPMTYIAQWNDDMHHVLDFSSRATAGRPATTIPARIPIADFEKALADGFVHDPSEGDSSDGRTRGGDGGRAAARTPSSPTSRTTTRSATAPTASGCPSAPGRSSSTSCTSSKFLAPQIPLCFMGDEGNLTSRFPFFVDLGEEAAKAKRDDRYKQIREMFNQPRSRTASCPSPTIPLPSQSAKLPWEDYYDEA